MTTIRLRLSTYEDSETLEKRVAAQAIDAKTGEFIAVFSLKDMANWLKENCFHYIPASNGLWSLKGRFL